MRPKEGTGRGHDDTVKDKPEKRVVKKGKAKGGKK